MKNIKYGYKDIYSLTDDEFCIRYENLVYSIANKIIVNNEHDREDIIQHGFIGLMKAKKGFNKEKNISFITFATKCIRFEMLQSLRRDYYKYWKVNRSTQEEVGGNGSDENLLTLGDTIKDKEEDVLEKILEIELSEENKYMCNKIFSMLKNDKEKIIFKEYIMKNRKMKDIANELGIKRPYASKIKEKAIKRIREELNINI